MLVLVPAFWFVFWRSFLRARGRSGVTYSDLFEQTVDTLQCRNTALERIAAVQEERTQGL
jgi:hypothetical protein